MSRASESARQREFFRYYGPLRNIGTINTIHRENNLAQSSSDAALTAFAQLGALRLNAARCIISLVGAKREYVLADASQDLSLQHDQKSSAKDDMRRDEVELETRAEVGLILKALLTDTTQSAVSHVAIGDLQQDERFKHLPMVTEPPFLRSLVCYPLRTPQGYVIGLYCIVDDKPRQALTDVERQVLEDMTRTTMDYIEAARVKQRHHRSERMIKALALFLDGHDSLRSWWLSEASEGSNAQQSGHRDFLEDQADQVFGVRDGPDRISRTTFENLEDELDFQRGSSWSASLATPGNQNVNPPSHGTSRSSEDSVVFREPRVPDLQSSTSESPTLNSLGTSVASSSTAQSRSSTLLSQNSNHLPGKELQEALLSTDLKKTFSRASNLLREAIDIDGAAFFDASIGSFGAGSARRAMEPKAPGAHTFDSIPGTTTSGSDGGLHPDTVEQDQGTAESLATLIGYSTRSRSSLENHDDSEMLGAFPDELLRLLARRYPHGKVFNFEDDGSISSSDIENHSADSQYLFNKSPEPKARKAKKRLTRQAEAAALLKILPGARSIGWFPLWDSMNERWYAGALIWTSSPTRVLTPEDEIMYMAAWGNSLMVEVSRLAALVASRMKVDFVSSISHELRSPLHGISASVESLQEAGGLPPLQSDMIDTINSCGKTLLDTINHVLEFANVHKKRSKRSKARPARKHQQRDALDTTFDDIFNLRVLAEEVVDSVYAGRIIKKTLHTTLQRLSPVIVIIDIPRGVDQNFKLNAGAFRRVLMNLFNNAIKYTDSGFVRVSLTIHNGNLFENGKAQPILHLVVSDSGKGISKEFIRNSLYRAFKQEDALSPGTGLGLSIVRRVLSDVGGAINMESEVGSGTTAIVTMPLKATNNSANPRHEMLVRTRRKTNGLQAYIFSQGFNVYPTFSDEPTGILSAEAQGLIHLRYSVTSILEDWFEMKVQTSAMDFVPSHADVFLTVWSGDFEDKVRFADVRQFGDSQRLCAIALCDGSFRGINFITEKGIQVYYLRLPVTPNKLGQILCNAFSETHDSPAD